MLWLGHNRRIRRLERIMDTLANDTARLAADVAALKTALANYTAAQAAEIAKLKAAAVVDTTQLEANLADFEAAIASIPQPSTSAPPASA